jgi:hypothetical protein
MNADDRPIATRAALVRQLASSAFRTQPVPTSQRRAFVLGNPSTSDASRHPGTAPYADLPAAESEARAVTDSLARQGFEVERALGQDHSAAAVVTRLYRHPYRIVHMAGHGIRDMSTGHPRWGVVLSDGLLIGAAEVAAMEVVPDLVFVNCCHLGHIDAPATALNALASGIARQLIEIGVRCVVVAGWAVEDEPASLFAQTFYDELLSGSRSFGEAVLQARTATWAASPAGLTWGAYQAWGDPAWRLDAGPAPSEPAWPPPSAFISPHEVLDKLSSLAADISGDLAPEHGAALREWVAGWPPDWSKRPDLALAAAQAFKACGPVFIDDAIALLTAMVGAAEPGSDLPMQALHLLATLEIEAADLRHDATLSTRGRARLAGLRKALAPGRKPRRRLR